MAAASTLPAEVVEEILLRIPTDEPAHLAHAALVCKAWRSIILSGDGAFLRRYRGFHRRPPLLGFVQNLYNGSLRFVPASAAYPVPAPAIETPGYNHLRALDCRHGRVLIHASQDTSQPEWLIVWDPITGVEQRLGVPTYNYKQCAGYVLCATDGCDHLDCGGGPFLVVFVWTEMNLGKLRASIYSSETGSWSAPTSVDISCNIYGRPGVLIGDTLYLTVDRNSYGTIRILKYDLRNHVLSVVVNDMPAVSRWTLLMKGEDGGLQLITISDNYCIHMWSQQDVTDGIGGWVKHKVMEQQRGLLSPMGDPWYPRKVIGFVEGTSIIVITSNTEIFTLDLKSRQVRKVCHRYVYEHSYPILPYVGFYAPK